MKITEKSRKNLLEMDPDAFDHSNLSDEEWVALKRLNPEKLSSREKSDAYETQASILDDLEAQRNNENHQKRRNQKIVLAVATGVVTTGSIALGFLVNWGITAALSVAELLCLCGAKECIDTGSQYTERFNQYRSIDAKISQEKERYDEQAPTVEDLKKFQAAHNIANYWQRSVEKQLFKNTEMDQALLPVLNDNKKRQALSGVLCSGLSFQVDVEIPIDDKKSITQTEAVDTNLIVALVDRMVDSDECSPKTRIAWKKFYNTIKAKINPIDHQNSIEIDDAGIEVLTELWTIIRDDNKLSNITIYDYLRAESESKFNTQARSWKPTIVKENQEDKQPLLPKKSHVTDIEAGKCKFDWNMNL